MIRWWVRERYLMTHCPTPLCEDNGDYEYYQVCQCCVTIKRIYQTLRLKFGRDVAVIILYFATEYEQKELVSFARLIDDRQVWCD